MPAPTPTPCTASNEAIRRANLYLEAGADMAFLDGIGTRADIERAVREIHGLLSVNLMDGVTGVKTELIPIPELARLGVARVSIPVASIMVAHKALVNFFTDLRRSPTGILAGETERLSSFKQYTAFVGPAGVPRTRKPIPARQSRSSRVGGLSWE